MTACGQRRVEARVVVEFHDQNVDRCRCCSGLDCLELIGARRCIPQNGNSFHIGNSIADQLKPLAAQGRRVQKETGEVASRMSQARYIAAGDGIAFEIVCDYRQLGRCRSRRFYGRTRCWNEYIRAELDKLASQLRKSVRFAVRPACFDFDGLSFDIAGLVEPLAQGIEDRRSGIWKSRMEKPTIGTFCAGCERVSVDRSSAAPARRAVNLRRVIRSIIGAAMRAQEGALYRLKRVLR